MTRGLIMLHEARLKCRGGIHATCPMVVSARLHQHGDFMRKVLTLAFLLFTAAATWAQQYDVVILNGRVMDAETGLDAVRNVGIKDGQISRITSEAIRGGRTIDAKGLVVTAGFIDVHQHGQDLASQKLKAFDGVTTALEMEIGDPDVGKFLAAKKGRSILHYGTAASRLRRAV